MYSAYPDDSALAPYGGNHGRAGAAGVEIPPFDPAEEAYASDAFEGSGYGPFPEDHHWPPRQAWPDGPEFPRKQAAFFVLTGLVWGLTATFSARLDAVIGGEGSWGGWTIAIGLCIATLMLFLYARGPQPLLAALQDVAGVFILFNALVALISIIVASRNPLFAARYLMLAVAFALCIYSRDVDARALAALRVGLTAAGVTLVLYIAQDLPVGQFSNPGSRLGGFLNPSALGFIAAMTAVSLLDFALVNFSRGGRLFITLAILASLMLCALEVYMTRSRTATACVLGGVITLIFLRARLWVRVLLVLFGVASFLMLQGFFSDVGQTFVDAYQLGEHGRDLTTLTGRTTVWNELFTHLILPNPFLGAGPGAVSQYGPAHNAILMELSEVGLLGTLPVVAVLVICAISGIVHRKNVALHWAIAIFTAGLLESLAEANLFNFGNPASLLFLAAVAALAGAMFRRPPEHDTYPAAPDAWATQLT